MMVEKCCYIKLLNLCCGLLFLSILQPATAAPEELGTWDSIEKSELNSMLTAHLQYILTTNSVGGRNVDGQVEVRADPDTGIIVISLSNEFIPNGDPAKNEDLEGLLSEEIQHLVRGAFSIREVTFLYGGRSIHDYFQPKPKVDFDIDSNVSSQSGPGNGPIVVSAGHGQYYHYTLGWTAQRDPSFGMTEDYITPVFAALLGDELTTPFYLRSTSTDIHTPSGLEWKNVSARYHLQNMFPTFNYVWSSYSQSHPNDAEHERIDDIYSRPFITNSIDAKALLSLHTNAGPPSARGTRVHYYPGRQESNELATRILCSMEGIIQAKAGYEEWNVADLPVAENHAETREVDLAIPSVIVEIGFHTNSDDAAALQEPEFQKASMRGVAKGYHLYTAGKPCEELKITGTSDVTAQTVAMFTFEVSFEGNPISGLYARLPDCGGGVAFGCQKVEISTQSPAIATDLCAFPGTTVRRIWLEDVDGVISNEAEYTVTCL